MDPKESSTKKDRSIAVSADTSSTDSARALALAAVKELESRYADRLEVNHKLNRSVVSFQANKSEPIFRWFKYREGFSRLLIEYCLTQIEAKRGDTIFDPFAGTGATIFTASSHAMNGVGVELLPVGAYFMAARQLVNRIDKQRLIDIARKAISQKPWKKVKGTWRFQHLRITAGAFSDETERDISRFKSWTKTLDADESQFFDFVLFSILEEISFTRKDGQYLRWDSRSPRKLNGTFDKGEILSFEDGIQRKLQQIIVDLEPSAQDELFPPSVPSQNGEISVLLGSVFERIHDVPDLSISHVITSPPYCNRYDYTRTYALELAYLGIGEDDIKSLRQSLLTCTVENRPKSFDATSASLLRKADEVCEKNKGLQAVLGFLQAEKEAGRLNNNGILTMVRGYFYETALHLAQVNKKMRRGGCYVMVNDNVRYNGLDVPVDCLLSSIAEDLGFFCRKIWVLPIGKGNSSQQMKLHGRSELRKCVYVWQKK